MVLCQRWHRTFCSDGLSNFVGNEILSRRLFNLVILLFLGLHAQEKIFANCKATFYLTSGKPLVIPYKMANDYFRKPLNLIAPIYDHLRGGAIPPYGVTTRKTRRVVGRSQVGLLLTLLERSTGVSSMQKVVRVPYLSISWL